MKKMKTPLMALAALCLVLGACSTTDPVEPVDPSELNASATETDEVNTTSGTGTVPTGMETGASRSTSLIGTQVVEVPAETPVTTTTTTTVIETPPAEVATVDTTTTTVDTTTDTTADTSMTSSSSIQEEPATTETTTTTTTTRRRMSKD
jgi:hypothetical protein